MRVRRVVVDDESRVHRHGPGVRRDHVMRVRVAPESARSLEKCHVEATLEQVCRGESGHPDPMTATLPRPGRTPDAGVMSRACFSDG